MSDDEHEEFNTSNHKKLLSEIQDLVKTQHIKKPVRSEPSKKLSEFHLSKVSFENEDEVPAKKKNKKKVTLEKLTDVITKNTKQKQVSKQLKNAFRAEKVLKKPLERIHADRLERTVAYEQNKKKLGRWDAVVTKNKLADEVFFPLQNEKTDLIENPKNLYERRYRTELGKKLQEIFPQKEETEQVEDVAKLSLREMIQKKKEMNRIKMRESYKISKAKKQGKIKSKTYHKLMKREKLKEKMKEFESLKATDPEAALKELEKIERQRVEERATLRHKNTGTWAKNLKVLFN
jgi:U3 small nucleolar RNA-associated protein 14